MAKELLSIDLVFVLVHLFLFFFRFVLIVILQDVISWTPSWILSGLLLIFAFFLLLSFIGVISLSRWNVSNLGLLRLRMLYIRSQKRVFALNARSSLWLCHKLLRFFPLLRYRRCMLPEPELLKGFSWALEQGCISVG